MIKLYCCIFSTFLLATSVLGKTNTSQESVLYKISGKGLKKTSYLFGTIHIYDPNVIQLPQPLFGYLEETTTLVLEILPNDMETGKDKLMAGLIASYKDSTLSALLSEKAYQNLLSFPYIKMMGDNINLFIPIFVYQLLFFNSEWKSVEQVLAQQAGLKKKKMIALESVEEQIKVLQSISIKEQIAELEYWLTKENPQTTIEQLMQSLFNAYAQQSIQKFVENMEYTNLLMESSPQLISERDMKMAEKIGDLLNTSDNFFVAVGALHLQNKTNNGGIVNILRKKGYTLTPVNVKLKVES